MGAVTNGGFATRACQAAFISNLKRIEIVKSAADVDIDVLGADLGFGRPVVAFVVRPTLNDWHVRYEIWSLDQTPRLLRTLTGGDSYRAADADLNRHVAIWTTDAAAVTDFDGLSYSDFDSPPIVALRYEHGSFVDVSAWYPARYDQQIAGLQGNLTANALAEFRNSDGPSKWNFLPADKLAALRRTRVTVLEIVLAYLYSGRADRAWAELETAWPPSDITRTKAAILAARSRGIETQVASRASSPPRSLKWLQTAAIYEYLKPTEEPEPLATQPAYNVLGTSGPGSVRVVDHVSSLADLLAANTEPHPISLWRPVPSAADQASAFGQESLLLTIDEAGKVVSAQMRVPKSDPALRKAAQDWKFIPATRDGKPVAYKLKLDVQPFR